MVAVAFVQGAAAQDAVVSGAAADDEADAVARPASDEVLPEEVGESERERFENSLGMRFVDVSGTPILLSVWETRVDDFRAFVEESGYAWNETAPFEQDGSHPVVNVNRNDAVVFCQWLTRKEQQEAVLKETQSYRLPTNVEWSVAVAGGRPEGERRYPWGNAWPPPAGTANLASRDIDGTDDGSPFTAPVGSFAPATDDLHDLAGNVWEWCEDRDAAGGDAAPVPVLRGGAFNYFRAANLESGYRYEAPATMRAPSFGFRVVLEDRERNARFLASTRGAGASLQDAVTRMREEEEAKRAAEAAALAQEDILPEPTAQPAAGESFRSSLGLVFVPIEGQPFLAGSTEVRVKDLQTYARLAGHELPDVSFRQGPEHAAVAMALSEAEAFAEWLTARELEGKWLKEGQRYRLPTDREWSRIAGLDPDSPDGGPRFPWGDDWPPPTRTGNFEANRISGYFDGDPYTSAVAAYRENRAGIYDLSGNAAEWVTGVDGLAQGVGAARGASWTESRPEAMEAFSRVEVADGKGRPDIGFRLILDLGE